MQKLTITSPQSRQFAQLLSLLDARTRRQEGKYLAEGPHLLQEALQQHDALHTVVLCQGKEERFAQLVAQVAQRDLPVLTLPERLFNRLSGTKTTQGLLSVLHIPPSVALAALADASLLLLLDTLQDPGNLVTILRTALAVGVDAVLLSGGADAYAPKVVRAAQGAQVHLPIAPVEDALQTVHTLHAMGFATLCADMDGEDFFARPAFTPCCLIIGNEGAGVSAELAAACTSRVRLPMPGGAESLNAAVAAGVMLYDLMRARHAQRAARAGL